MGIEYSLRFEVPSAEAVAAELRHLPGARETAPWCFDLDGDPPSAVRVAGDHLPR